MKACVIGMGSIGTRHANNLTTLGIDVKGVDIGDKPSYDVDLAVIATPTETHLSCALDFALNSDAAIFLEKPPAESLSDLSTFLEAKWPLSMVACNLRFTDQIKLAKGICEEGPINAYHACVIDPSPSRLKYGPLLFQDIHEFDYLEYLMGLIVEIKFRATSYNNSYNALLVHQSGLTGTVMGGMFGRTYERVLSIRSKPLDIDLPIDVSNDMYVRQFKYFIQCIKEKKQPMNSIKESCTLALKLYQALDRGHYSSSENLIPVSE